MTATQMLFFADVCDVRMFSQYLLVYSHRVGGPSGGCSRCSHPGQWNLFDDDTALEWSSLSSLSLKTTQLELVV